MGKLNDYITRLKAIDEQSQTTALLSIINKHKAQLIDLNQAQMLQGRNANGEQLGTYRSKSYADFKNRLNPAPGLGVWDLHLTGALYSEMFVDADSFPVTIDSKDDKADKFRDASPFGLEPKSKIEYVEEITPEIKEYYRSILQL